MVILCGLSGLVLGASIKRWGLWASLALLLGAVAIAVENPPTFVTFLVALGSLAGGCIIGRLVANQQNRR